MTGTTTATLDLSRVSELEKRQQAKVLLDEIEKIEERKYDTAFKPKYDAWRELARKVEDERKAARARYDAELQAIDARHQPALDVAIAAVQAIDKDGPDQKEIDALQERIDALGVDFDWSTHDHEKIATCAVSGLPLLEGDEVWESDDHGKALMCLLLPADYEAEEEGDDRDSADGFADEEAA